MTARSFTPALFAFLRDLEANNDRAWFKANQQRYIDDVREPALTFINDFARPLGEISPHFVADSRTVGGSLFRIHRDTRFSKDKTPYKTNTGVHFRHVMAKDVHAPGYYLNLEPGGCFMGVGIWHPETSVAYQIRSHIAEHGEKWRGSISEPKFGSTFVLEGDSLVRPPRGYDADHPLIEDLKRKDFIATTKLTQRQVTSAGFVDEFAALCRTATPFMRFLCDAVGVAF